MAQFALIIAPTGQYLYRLGRVPVALPGIADETSPAALLARHTHAGDSLSLYTDLPEESYARSELPRIWSARMRDQLLAEPAAFRHLDAAQLVKHGFGLVTEAKRRGKSPVLLYLFAEPTEGRAIRAQAFADHRSEIARFAGGVTGSTVRFAACSRSEWLTSFPPSLSDHADRVIARFHP